MFRKVSILLSLVLFLSFLPAAIPAANAATDITWEEFADIIGTHSINPLIPTYREYRAQNPQNRPNTEIVIDAGDFTRYEEDGLAAEPEIFSGYLGMEGYSVLTTETGLIELPFRVEESGLYNILVDYFPIEGKSSPIQRSIFINGELPFREFSMLELNRVWQNRIAYESYAVGEPLVWRADNRGNHIRPTMIENPKWMSEFIYEVNGYISEPLSVYLEAGEHTLSFYSQREPMLLRRVTFKNREYVQDYQSRLAEWQSAGISDTSGQSIIVQAEYAARTSSQMLYPVQDQSSPAVTPSSPRYLLNNSIGGVSWRMAGQWVEWDFIVPETGFYELSFIALQNMKRGAFVSRRISINGEVPFSELEAFPFHFARNWKQDVIADEDGEPFRFFLEEGVNTIRLETVLGEYSEIISRVRTAVYDLNAIYRTVISLTGVNPDTFADYNIERAFPELTNDLTTVRDELNWVLEEMVRITGGGRLSERERILVTMRDQLNTLIADNERFPQVVSSFRMNIRACGTWLLEAMDQPLQLDKFIFHSPDEPFRLRGTGFFNQLWHELSRLFYSFIIDFNTVGDVAEGDTVINLWIGSGRDQAAVIRSLIDESFAQYHNIGVNVMLVDMTTLLQASLAGQGPDVAVQVGGELPMNFGMRGSVACLRGFDGFEEVRSWFPESAMVPYEYGDFTFALPETQIFPMMFYRKDILAELNMELPQTWNDVSVIMSELAFNHMEFGMLPNEQIFTTLLFQHGGNYYNENATASALDEEEAIAAFRQFTEFYTEYRLDRATSVEERFRTGETPIVINDYTFYNILQISAPELRGIWGMAPIPGRLMEDGTINRAASSNGGGVMNAFSVFAGVGGSGGACVMMSSTEHPEAVWEFMRWWSSAETQILFAREMESLMGPAARVPLANTEAFSLLPWPAADYRLLREQFQYVRGIPQVPGGYMTFRQVNNAFYEVTTPASDRPAGRRQEILPREALMDRVILINAEIRNKRTEFGLPLY